MSIMSEKKYDNKLITLAYWSGYVTIFVVLFVLKKAKKGECYMAKRRPNGDGLVRKREDGRWEGRIVAGHKKDGSPIYRAVFAEKQSELMPKLHQLKEQ